MGVRVGDDEIEIKLRVEDCADVRARLEALGYRETRARHFERNRLLDTQDAALRRRGEVLRVRETAGVVTLTWKGPGRVEDGHKAREERETTVADAEPLLALFGRLGYEPGFRYEKYRTEFALAGELGVVTLDETPIGTFLELEGPAGWINTTAARLGYTPGDYVTDSYGALYLRHCERAGLVPSHLEFAPHT